MKLLQIFSSTEQVGQFCQILMPAIILFFLVYTALYLTKEQKKISKSN